MAEIQQQAEAAQPTQTAAATSVPQTLRPVHHALSYIEIGVKDLAAACDFFARAFGWQFNDYGGHYAGIRAPGGQGEIGGLSPSAGAVSQPGTGRAAGSNVSNPLVLLFSTDLDATLISVRRAGGEIVSGPYEFPGGRRFEFLDPSGNRLGVFADS